jgi:hypothetical protein
VYLFCKSTYNNYFAQLKQLLASDSQCSKVWKRNLEHMMVGKLVPTIVGPPVTNTGECRAFWNPCCGGMFNAFLCYRFNVEGGAAMIDSLAQLRMVLHLYNALQQRNLISGNIPLLTSLDKYFEGVPGIWEGAKPSRDNIVKRFWLVYGDRVDVLNRIHEKCRWLVEVGFTWGDDATGTRDGLTTR